MIKQNNRMVGTSTLVNHLGEHDHASSAHTMPVFQTSTYGFEIDNADNGIGRTHEPDRYVYTRGGSPNSRQLARKIAHLEGRDLINARPGQDPDDLVAGEITASGLSAITTVALAVLSAGDTAIVQRASYGGSLSFWDNVAPKYGIKVVFVDTTDLDSWKQASLQNPQAKLFYIETPSTPLLEIYDLDSISDLAHSGGAVCVVDNTAATPFHQTPLSFGVDYVIHSLSKYINGHGLVIGGAIVSRRAADMHVGGLIWDALVMNGATPSPHDCWLTNNGLKTLELRMQSHSSNAAALAQMLVSNPYIERVYYPGLTSSAGHTLANKQMKNGFGGLLSFEIKGGKKPALDLLRNLRLPVTASSFGTTDSLIQHTDTMSHSYMSEEHRRAAGITPGLIRMSVGIENIEDLMADFDQAFDRLQKIHRPNPMVA